MRRQLFFVVVNICLIGYCEDPNGSYRWETMPASMRSNMLEQVSIRRAGVRLSVLRASLHDIYRDVPIALRISKKTQEYLRIMDVCGLRVYCNVFPWFYSSHSNEDGILVYKKYANSSSRLTGAFWLPEEHHLLCILDRVYQPLPRIDGRIHEIQRENEQFCEDYWRLSGVQLTKKYGLEEVFSNSVYRVRSACMMVVDYPSPEDKSLFIYDRKNGVLDWHYEVDRRMIERRKRMGRWFIGSQHMLILSQEEASELVALVGHQWYLGDDSKYREMRREYPWFQPVDVAHPGTQLGKDLKATIEAKERTEQR